MSLGTRGQTKMNCKTNNSDQFFNDLGESIMALIFFIYK